MALKKRTEEEIEREWQEYLDREASVTTHGCLRIVVLIVIVISAIILGT